MTRRYRRRIVTQVTRVSRADDVVVVDTVESLFRAHDG
jgi:hypothetical protein